MTRMTLFVTLVVAFLASADASVPCTTNMDCAKGSYCMNDATKMAPFVCHGKVPMPYSAEALTDEISNLPGAPADLSFRMFSGHIDVTPPTAPSGNVRKMFYWFVESQGDPSTDPLMLWTNGGPGCSGLTGFLTEQGPFRPTKDGKLEMNDYSWNKLANMVFIEQPVGVGFSHSSGPDTIVYGDEPSAQDNYAFVRGFLSRFGAYNATDFYISSESYGGHYMPTLAREILKQGGVPSFKGVAVGNPLTWMPYRNYGQYGTAYGHQLLPKPLFDEYLAAKCKDTWPTPAACGSITDQMDKLLDGFDAYALDFPVCEDNTKAAGRHERYHLLRTIARANEMASVEAAGEAHAQVGGYFPEKYVPCAGDYGATYLNRMDVQKAIHAFPACGTNCIWQQCSNMVGSNFNVTDTNAPMMPVWKEILAMERGGSQKLKLLIYSGDDDSVCATLGTQQFMWDLGLNVAKDWSPWHTPSGQVGGFLTRFDDGEGAFDFATVHGAGHMVPATRPAQSLQVIANFLGNKW